MSTARSVLVMATAIALVAPIGAARPQAVVGVPGASLSFIQPTGTVTPTASIDVWLRLALGPTATAFTFNDGSPGAAFDLPPALVPTIGVWNGVLGTIDHFTSAYTTTGFGCFNTFTGACGPPAPYTFDFSSAFFDLPSLTIAPGGWFDFLFGTFTPTAGGAPPGVYSFTIAEARIEFNAVDANGAPLVAGLSFGTTCSPPTSGCEFTRTVAGGSVAPEPASMALLATGLTGIGVVARRRRRDR